MKKSQCVNLSQPNRHLDVLMYPDRKIRIFFLFLLLAHACFIIYGSLVPFSFESVPLSRAWTEFTAVLTTPPAVYFNANLLANILIGIPGPFLILGAFHAKDSRPPVLLLSAAFFYSALLASAAEFLQLFTPLRMTALSDILAQTAGGFLGLLAWLWAGPYIRTMLKALIFREQNPGTANFLFLCYTVVLLFLYVLPLDLSARPGSLYNQFESGQILLMPFAHWSSLFDLFHSLPSILLWVPVGWFLVRGLGWPLPGAMLVAAAGAACLEFLQIFVLSRTTDTTNIILAATGGLTGGFFGRSKHIQNPGTASASRKKALWCGALFSGWLAFVLIIFWMPFTFTFEQEFLKERIREIGLIPFQLYLGKPYLHSALNILSNIVYFLPMGILFSTCLTRHLSGPGARAMSLLFLILVGLVAGIIEFGQVFIPERYPDITDWLCMVAGAMLGYNVTSLVWKKVHRRQ